MWAKVYSQLFHHVQAAEVSERRVEGTPTSNACQGRTRTLHFVLRMQVVLLMAGVTFIVYVMSVMVSSQVLGFQSERVSSQVLGVPAMRKVILC